MNLMEDSQLIYLMILLYMQIFLQKNVNLKLLLFDELLNYINSIKF
jgi:hypothetical protein